MSSYRDRLVAFYEKYAPRKVGQVDAQLEKYAGREEDFFAALVQKYGPEPGNAAGTPAASRGASPAFSESATPTTMDRMSSYRDRLVAFYEKYAPRKVGQVDAQLEKYAGREEDFFAALVQKYGPEPGNAAGTPAASRGASPAFSESATPTTMDRMSSYRDRLVAFYEKYAPRKVGQVDAQLEKYAGREEDFFAALVQKYGPEPGNAAGTPAASRGASPAFSESATPTTMDRMSSYRDRLVAFYEKYAPRKVGQVDAQLEKYAGREEDFFAALVQKYGPEPGNAAGTPAASRGASPAVSELATPAVAGAAEMNSFADHHQPTSSETIKNTVAQKVDANARNIADEDRRERLRALAAQLGVAVKSDDPLQVLSALVDARRDRNFGTTSPVRDADARVCQVLNESMYAPSTSRLTASVKAMMMMDSRSPTDLSVMLAAVNEEEAESRTTLELLAADDFDILLAARRRALRSVGRDGALSSLRASAEAALLQRVWRGWHDTAADYVKQAMHGRHHQRTRYQKMLFSKSVAMYYDRIARSQRQQERRRRQVDAANAQANAMRRRRLRETIAEHGNLVNRNIRAVLLRQSPGAHNSRDTPETPEQSPDAVFTHGKAEPQRTHSQRLAQSPYWHGDSANHHGSGDRRNNRSLSFYSYGSRSARLLAIERDFDRLPSDARARVVRRLQKWDILPKSPTQHFSRGFPHLQSMRERGEQLARRLDTLDAFAAVADEEDTPPQWWKSETELRQYLARVLIDAFDAEEREMLGLPYEVL
ncbi:hypothetical protein C3747_189g61 [Trypanosoma cruzi]|uniref:Uncharacterized protein n=2 Tax=Trypanosoma cruzi TaxID=5693 RepID=Q4DPQ5_TRYCC|nr:hypothetical protein Tc00.1047053511181.140 [Trypanosoma cruzi]EAN94518.1 hypothetical protein Tc00.1047053511181.140 [Trypanosoma cruzi]PWV02210.1 hypothetical protein C3747_189g61 [Trypanosoma cruzi]|eukprot:XP_816369.1 hypothetical protein [Trypanosoma cruzi strain CL Brener]